METVTASSKILEHNDYLRRLAWNFTRNEEDAADLFQDTVCRVVEKIGSFKQGTNLRAWASVIMRNLFINAYRAKKKKTIVPIENTSEYLNEFHAPSEVDYNFFMEDVSRAMEKLDDQNIELINLLRQGYSYKKMAKMLDLPMGTIKSRIHKSRKALKYELAKMN